MIKNLISFSEKEAIENHVIYTIEASKKEQETIIDFPKAASVQVFHYNKKWNFYHTCKQLAKLLPDDRAVVVAHDWLELGMCSQLGLQNPVVYFLHGDYDYYYDLAKKHEDAIDQFITVAAAIHGRLEQHLPSRKADIRYLRFPVPDMKNRQPAPGRCNLAFIGRLSSGKGYDLLPRIGEVLIKQQVPACWHIAGADVEGMKEKLSWPSGAHVKHYGALNSDAVAGWLQTMDYLVLPSLYEGMPVTVIEAMKAGVIPIVNDIGGGIQELVVEGETGYKIKGNEVHEFANRIAMLHGNHGLAERLRQECILRSNHLFDPHENTTLIEKTLYEASLNSKNKRSKRVYGSRLDREWIPYGIVKCFRRF